MQRFFRHLFTALACTSLILCVAVCVFGIRSYSREDTPYIERYGGTLAGHGQRGVAIFSSLGTLRFNYNRYWFQYREALTDENDIAASGWGPYEWITGPPRAYPPLQCFDRFGFGLGATQTVYERDNDVETRSYAGARVPHWFAAIVLAILPARWIVSRRRAARKAASALCARCGYDLRATPDRCPECGTPAAK